MHQRIFGENLIKIGLILSAQWRFSEERYQACPVTLSCSGKRIVTSSRNSDLEAFNHKPTDGRFAGVPIIVVSGKCMSHLCESTYVEPIHSSRT